MFKKIIGVSLTSALFVTGMSPALAKENKVPSIAKKTVVWVYTQSKNDAEAESYRLPIKNRTKDMVLTGKNVQKEGTRYTIATSNKNFTAYYDSQMAKYGLGIYASGKVSDALVGQKGTVKFNVVINHRTYPMKTSFTVKKNPGLVKYLKVNGKNVLSRFKEDQYGDFGMDMKLANKKVNITYKVLYPNKDYGVRVLREKGKEFNLKKNMVLKKGDLILISVMAPGWLKASGYAIQVK